MNKIFAVLWAVTLVVVIVIAIGAADMYRVDYMVSGQGTKFKHDRSTHQLYRFQFNKGWVEVMCDKTKQSACLN